MLQHTVKHATMLFTAHIPVKWLWDGAGAYTMRCFKLQSLLPLAPDKWVRAADGQPRQKLVQRRGGSPMAY